MSTCRYGISLWVFNSISHEWVQRTSEISSRTREEIFHIYKQPCIYVYMHICIYAYMYICIYYMEKSVLLGTKPLVDSIRHFIRDPSGIFSVCHLCECCTVQWLHDSRLLLLLNWFLHIIKRTLHVGSKIWILCSSGKNNISLVHFAHSWDIVLATWT